MYQCIRHSTLNRLGHTMDGEISNVGGFWGGAIHLFESQNENFERYLASVLFSVPNKNNTPQWEKAVITEIIHRPRMDDFDWDENSYLKKRVYRAFPNFDNDFKHWLKGAVEKI